MCTQYLNHINAQGDDFFTCVGSVTYYKIYKDICVSVCVCVWWGGGEGYWPHSVNDYLVPQDQLWAALKAGHIDMVVSDHSPCTTDLKKLDSGDFTQAWGGISSLQFGNNSNRCILEAVQP